MSPEDSQKEIRRAYLKMARQYHPDTNPEDGAEERMKLIIAAYEVLGDPEKRVKYDSISINNSGNNTSNPSPKYPEVYDIMVSPEQGFNELLVVINFGRNEEELILSHLQFLDSTDFSNTFKEKINYMMWILPRIRDGYIAQELESQKARRPEEIARKECQRSFSFSQQSAILDTQHMSEIAPAVNAAYRAQGKEQLQFENIDKVKIDLAYLEELLNTTQDITEMENARGQVLLYTRSIAIMSEKMDIAFKDIQAQYRIISEKLFGDPVYLPKANDIVTNFENYYKKAIDDGAAERQDYITQTIIDQGSVELSLADQAGLDREQKYHLQQLFDSAYSTPTKLDRDRKKLERLYRKPYTYVKQMEIIKPSDFSSSNVDNGDQKQQKSVFQNLKSGFSKYLNGTKETLSSGIKYVSDKVKGAVKSVRENTSSQLNKLFGRSTKNK